jgi:hypothetical protein
MKLTVKEVHTYNDLVKEGKADPLSLPALSDGAIVITKVDENDEVYFYDLVENINIYPGKNTIKKIKNTLAFLDKE